MGLILGVGALGRFSLCKTFLVNNLAKNVADKSWNKMTEKLLTYETLNHSHPAVAWCVCQVFCIIVGLILCVGALGSF